ncbi:Protein 60A [Gryllus bimaculatus]|uniref:Myoglianin n=1 Tax=Gryllus bimaculatus TaxID=6999 RepID=A0A160PBD6_GRYBI|nr:myoglianin [Gryllus bimaculatus]GLH11674.1 Protein 60A [Gryllus bimaculatus]
MFLVSDGAPKIRHNHKLDIQYFRFSEKITRNKVERAFLWVYVKGLNWTTEKEGRASAGAEEGGGFGAGPHLPLNITLWHVDASAGALSGAHDLQKVQVISDNKKHHRHTGRGEWLRLDVHKLLAEWFRRPTDSLGLLVQVTDESGHQLVVTDPNEDDGMLVPYIEVTTTDKRKHRTKRTIGLNCDESSDETRCCRYPLTVDFEEFGWDWIIAPKKYEANYCSGECPYVFLQKYPHTHIVHLAHPTGTVGPCCAPRKMSAISMLYFDNEFNIIYGLLPGMVVDRCGCS